MMPHSALGINFRKHFESRGYSLKRSKAPIEAAIQRLLADIKKDPGLESFAQDRLTKLRGQLKEIKRRGR